MQKGKQAQSACRKRAARGRGGPAGAVPFFAPFSALYRGGEIWYTVKNTPYPGTAKGGETA